MRKGKIAAAIEHRTRNPAATKPTRSATLTFCANLHYYSVWKRLNSELNYLNDRTVNAHASCAGSLVFEFQAGQILHSVANGFTIYTSICVVLAPNSLHVTA